MIAEIAAMTLLLLFASGLTASGCYWAWRSYLGWKAAVGRDDTSGEGGLAIAGAGIALSCFVAVVRIAIELTR